ncbi:MAG: outer membrane beta-barrel protein [Flavobacteriales bacterium]|nr:hypothetical protein [Flavobacteriales bacterium]MCC6576192.1 outer membrane beta-barrel protein [Flavobacteriales bacterium]NUQ16025.1 outer membrane beta-barrel protein [Flavobacteriales bacterium]
MKKHVFIAAFALLAGAASAQFQANPQLGLTYQDLTHDADANVEFRSNIGWQLGVDFRIGNKAYIQPGVFFGRNVTAVKTTFNDSVLAEGDLMRTNLRLKLLGGYRIVDSYQFDLRFFLGPTYDVLLSVDDRDDRIGWNKGDFNKGSFNVDAGLGFDMGMFTLEPSVSFGLSRVFSDNLRVKDIGSRYLTYGLTVGLNFGDDDRRD